MFRPAVLLLLLVPLPAAAAPSPLERYFDGLRQRGLFDLAEGEALRRLAADPPLDERADLVAALARTFAEHAKFTTGDEQTDLWNRADALVREFLEQHPQSPVRARLDLLVGELALTQGETLRWLAELNPEQPDHATRASSSLDAAVAALTALEQSLSRRFRDALRGRSPRPDPLPAADLEELLTRTRLLLGTAELERARLAAGEDRSGHTTAAERWLTPVSKGPDSDDPTWRAALLLAESARLAGKLEVARRRLAELEPASLSDAAKDEFAAVSTKLLLAEGKPDRAVAFLIDYRRTRGSLTGELRLLQVRGLSEAAAAVEKLGSADEAAALRTQIPTVVAWTEAEHGGYWAYRARLAARGAERIARYGPEIAEQVRRAEAALALGRTDDALAAYADAATRAADSPELAAELNSARATLLLRAARFEEAAAAFHSLALTHPDPAKAAESHLLSAYALGRLHEATPTAERREAYVARLEEHRARFPGSPTAAEATVRLARVYEQRRQYSRTIPLLMEIVNDPERGPAAAAAIARNYESLLLYLRSSRDSAPSPADAAARNSQLAEWSFAAIRDLTNLTETLRSDLRSSPLSASEAELALRAARIFLTHADEAPQAAHLLDRLDQAFAAEHPAAEQSFWEAAKRAALPLRIVSLAASDRLDEASRLVDSLSTAPVGDLLAVVRGLADLAEDSAANERPAEFGVADGPVGPRLRDLRRTASEMLLERRAELSPEEARQLDVVLAEANLADGRSASAVERFETALVDRPDDKALLAQAAAALAASTDPSALRRARDYWRRLETLEKPGSVSWLRARLGVIESSAALGDAAEARKLLTVTRLLYPQLGDANMRAAFDDVQQRLDAGDTSIR